MKKLFLVLIATLGGSQIANAFDLTAAYQQALIYNADYLKQIASTDSTLEQKKHCSSTALAAN